MDLGRCVRWVTDVRTSLFRELFLINTRYDLSILNIKEYKVHTDCLILSYLKLLTHYWKTRKYNLKIFVSYNEQNLMNILIFRTPCNSVYICIFRPHMYSVFTHAPFARNSIYSVVTQRDHEYDLNNCQGILSSVLYILRSFVSLEKLSSCLKITESRIESYIVKFRSLY